MRSPTTQESSTRVHRPESVSGEGFQTVLVGKDGGPKVSSSQPIAANELVTTIDAMPVHQQEMQQQ
jgi:hypothetical protein